jgi:hypothetical protein
MAWELGGGLGHCVKLAPLAQDLIARGHEVYFAARDVVTAQQFFQNPAVKYLQAPLLSGRPLQLIKQPRSVSQILHNAGFGDDNQLHSLVSAWRSLLELVRPTIIICEHAPFALLASRWIDASRIVMGTGFSLPPDVSPLPDLLPWLSHPPVDLARQEAVSLDRVNRLLAADRLAPLERLSQLYSDVQESILMTFAELDHHPNRGPAKYWGSWSPRSGASVEWPMGKGPCVFAYLKGSVGQWRLESVLDLLRKSPLRTVVHIPDAGPSVVDLQSPSLRISSERVDIAAQLKDCNLAIINGTAGAGTQCLLAGVPLLTLPLYMEQLIFSRRVVELGAGLVAEPNRVEQFAPRLSAILEDDCYRKAAREFARRYADYDAEQRQREAVDRIAACLNPI